MNCHVGVIIIFGSFLSKDVLILVYYSTTSYMQKNVAKGSRDFF